MSGWHVTRNLKVQNDPRWSWNVEMKTKWWKMIEIAESFTVRMKKTTSRRETFWLQLK